MARWKIEITVENALGDLLTGYVVTDGATPEEVSAGVPEAYRDYLARHSLRLRSAEKPRRLRWWERWL